MASIATGGGASLVVGGDVCAQALPRAAVDKPCRGAGRPWQGLAPAPTADRQLRGAALPRVRLSVAKTSHGQRAPWQSLACDANEKTLRLAWPAIATGPWQGFATGPSLVAGPAARGLARLPAAWARGPWQRFVAGMPRVWPPVARPRHGPGRPWQGARGSLARCPAARGTALPRARPPAAKRCRGPCRPLQSPAAGLAKRCHKLGRPRPRAGRPWQLLAAGPVVRGKASPWARASR